MLLKSKRVWCTGKFIPLIVEIKNGKINKILDYNTDIDIDFDFGNNRILPGFIDIHTHGGYSYDTTDSDTNDIIMWAKTIAKEGVTSFLPTTITQSEKILKKALKNVTNAMNTEYEGAEILGIHLEGPFLNNNKRGAQPIEHITLPNIELFKKLNSASNQNIKLVTLACELDEDYKLTKYLTNNNIIVSLGHSNANYKESLLAFANGAKSQTHVFNGMTEFHHRNNGQVGFALNNDEIFGEIICDGIHSTIEALQIFFKSKGKDYGIVITDSISAKGLKQSKTTFGNEQIYIDETGLVTREDGTLAGSTATMINSLKLLIEDANIPINYAINSCTKNPATLLGFQNKKGILKTGYDADITVISDQYEVIMTITNGKIVYKR